jgi:predicted nucleotidyltransferase
MHWPPPWLGQAFARLESTFPSRPFSTHEAADSLQLSVPRANLTLSRLAEAGWCVRVARGRYRSLDPKAILVLMEAERGSRWDRRSFWPNLRLGVSEVFRQFGPGLASLALFGSCARHDERPGSDIDLLLVLRHPMDRRERRQRLVRVADSVAERNVDAWAHRRAEHRLGLLDWTLDELAQEPMLLLELIEDGRVLFDPERHLHEAFVQVRRKLRDRHAVQVQLPTGERVWDLDPAGKATTMIEAL